MDKEFDIDRAKHFLSERERKENEQREQERQQLLEKVISTLKSEFSGQSVEVFLVGSIIHPYKFTHRSDVDIVLKNFTGDRFAIWTRLENLIKRDVEVILYEKCHFKEYLDKEGLKVL